MVTSESKLDEVTVGVMKSAFSLTRVRDDVVVVMAELVVMVVNLETEPTMVEEENESTGEVEKMSSVLSSVEEPLMSGLKLLSSSISPSNYQNLRGTVS